MRQKKEFLITGAQNETDDVPEWFDDVLKSTVGYRTTLETWGKELSTELDRVDLFANMKSVEEPLMGLEEVDDYDLVVSDDTENDVICVATNRYNLIQNEEVVEQVVDVIERFNVGVVGFVRDYKEKVAIDLYPVHNTVLFESPDVEDSLAFGLEVRVGHDKTESIKARPVIRDRYDSTVLRGVTEWEKLKHVKPEDVDSKDITTRMYRMFAKSLFNLGYMAESYVNNVEKAYETKVDFSQEDFTLEEFYQEWLSQDFISDSIVEVAPRKAVDRAGITDDMVENLPEGETLNMWAIISGYTFALSHESSMTDGYNKDRFHQIASNALNNPEKVIENVREEVKEEEQEEVDIEEKAAVISGDLSDI